MFKYLGISFKTFITAQIGDDIYLIDQHAGHERLLYDKFIQELENADIAIQPLLIPHIIETNYIETNYIKENIETLKEIGFDIEEFGENSYKVSTVPVLFENINLNEFFDNILVNIDNKLIVSKQNSIKDYIAKTACKTAVKGKDVLEKLEIDYLINELYQPNQVLLCPHGRPITTKISKVEIEKRFMRIV